MSVDNRIKNVFKNQTIFLTGGTGFLGKVLIEKLLRECGDLKRIYLLIRSKKGKTVEERYDEIFDQLCFVSIKSRNVNIKKKVVLMAGDCQQPSLGIGNDDLEILKSETNFVIHVAANVRFDQSLKEAALNVQATRDLLDIAKQMTSLKAFVFVSTAYSNCVHRQIKEDFYEPPMKYEFLMNLMEECDDEVLEKITPHILGKWPNTYVFTKSISESLVARGNNSFPTAIVRPGIIINSYKEPLMGWIDNMYGPLGVMLGAGYGIIRTFMMKKDCVAAIVPVDFVCNCVLAATWKTAKDKIPKTGIYNYVNYNKPITWGEFFNLTNCQYWEKPLSGIIWYKTLYVTENIFWNEVCTLLLHTLPAYLIDGVLWCLNKPRIAVKRYSKIDKVLALLGYFSTQMWDFHDDNVTNLWNEMDAEDRNLFTFRDAKVEWKDYLSGCVTGIIRFVAKDNGETDFTKRAKLVMFAALHYTLVGLFWFLIFKLVMFVLGIFF